GRALLVRPEEADDLPLDRDVIDEERRHRGVRGLEPDLPSFAVDALQRRAPVLEQRDRDLAVLDRRLAPHDDEVAVEDAVADHARALDAEREGLTPRHRAADADFLAPVLERLDRPSSH